MAEIADPNITDQRTATEKVLENPKLLSQILSGYLPLSDLKSTRLVNPLWNILSQEGFLRKSRLNSGTLINYLNLCETPFSDSVYIWEYPSYNHQNIAIRVVTRSDKIYDEFVTTITKVIGVTGPQIKSLLFVQIPHVLEEDGKIHSFDLGLLNNALTHVPNLIELYLITVIRQGWEFNPDLFLPDKDLVLNSVRKLTLDIRYDQHLEQQLEIKVQQFSIRLLRLLPNVKSLEIGRRRNDRFIIPFLKESSLALNSLDTLKINGYIGSSEDSVEILQLFLKLPKPLRELEFFRLFGVDKERRRLVELQQTILEKHKNTLEKVSIRFFCPEPTGPDRDRPGLHLPNMPKLKTLYLDTRHEFYTDEKYPSNVIDIKALLELGPIAFRAKFPSLTSLLVEILVEGRFDQGTYNDFFPDRGDLQFPQFTEVTVSYPDPGPTGTELSTEYLKWTLRMARMFPNVHNEHLTEARRRDCLYVSNGAN